MSFSCKSGASFPVHREFSCPVKENEFWQYERRLYCKLIVTTAAAAATQYCYCYREIEPGPHW